MAGSYTDYYENNILDGTLGGGTVNKPATVYVALFTANPTDAGGGTEVTGGSYARVAVTNNATNWPAAVAGAKSNGTVITFPTASASWGTVTGVAIMDAVSAGNMLMWSDLTVAKPVGSGDTFSFPIGQLTYSLT